jgi:hypothetical protein
MQTKVSDAGCIIYDMGRVTARGGNHRWSLRQAEHAENGSKYLQHFSDHSRCQNPQNHNLNDGTFFIPFFISVMENISPHRTFIEVLNNKDNQFWPDIDCGVNGSATESYNLVQQTEL